MDFFRTVLIVETQLKAFLGDLNKVLSVRGLTRPTVHHPTNIRNYVFLIVFYVLFDIRDVNTQ